MQDSIRSKLDLSYIRPQFLYPLNPPGQFSLNALTSQFNQEQGNVVDGQALQGAMHHGVRNEQAEEYLLLENVPVQVEDAAQGANGPHHEVLAAQAHKAVVTYSGTHHGAYAYGA